LVQGAYGEAGKILHVVPLRFGIWIGEETRVDDFKYIFTPNELFLVAKGLEFPTRSCWQYFFGSIFNGILRMDVLDARRDTRSKLCLSRAYYGAVSISSGSGAIGDILLRLSEIYESVFSHISMGSTDFNAIPHQ
jgi:hypothetical protein